MLQISLTLLFFITEKKDFEQSLYLFLFLYTHFKYLFLLAYQFEKYLIYNLSNSFIIGELKFRIKSGDVVVSIPEKKDFETGGRCSYASFIILRNTS